MLHRLKGWEEPLRTGWATTYRSAAVHWGEGTRGNYYVLGAHYECDRRYGEHFLGYTPTTGCNLSFFFPYWYARSEKQCLIHKEEDQR